MRRAAHLSPLLAGRRSREVLSFVNIDKGKNEMNVVSFSGKVPRVAPREKDRHFSSGLKLQPFPGLEG